MTRLLLLALLLPAAAVAPLCAPAAAQGLDMSKGGPIDVTAQDGMEWRQNDMMVIANGDARAVRGNVTVTADRLIARYRRKAPPPGTATPVAAAVPATPAKPSGMPGSPSDTGQNEIYRLEAEGHVRIFTATDVAVADHAVYDLDQAVLLLTGSGMSVTTPNQVMTARDSMEYWSQKHMAVGRGLATVNTTDGRRVDGDVLVGYTQPPPDAAAKTPAGGPAAPRPAAPPGKPGADPLAASGKLQRVEGFGHVRIRTPTETVTGDRGVYVAETGIARLVGNVHITRGQNQLDGDEALVNMRTGISSIVRNPGRRVQGLVMPNDKSADPSGAPGTPKAKPGSPSSTR